MSRKKKGRAKYHSVLLIVLIIVGLVIPASASADNAGVSLPVSQVFINYTTIEVEDTFQYRLTPLEKGNPMPGEDEEKYSFSIKGTETVDLEEIPFVRIGIYRYSLEQAVEKEEKGYTYDKSVYTVEIQVTNAAGGGLTASVLVYKGSGKTDEISFENTYRRADETGTETEPATKPAETETEPVTKPTETDTPGTEPVTKPTETDTPGTEPVTKPAETETPGTEPVTKPAETDTPGTEPATKPAETETLGTEPATKPAETDTPGTEPGTEPAGTEISDTEPVETETSGMEPGTGSAGTGTPGAASGTSVQTGDNSNLLFWFGLMLVSVLSLAGIQIAKIMKRTKEGCPCG